MRTLNLVLTDSTVEYQNGKCAGRIGEHNATRVVLALPPEMLAGVDHHLISFETGYGAVVSNVITSDSSQAAYLQGGKIYCTLWQELTRSPMLLMTVEAYAVLNGKPVMIAKSPIIDGLYFELAVDGDLPAQADTGATGLAAALLSLQASEHAHANLALLDTLTLGDAHYFSAERYSDLPQGLPKGAAAYVRSGGAALGFGLYGSLVCAAELEDADLCDTSGQMSFSLLGRLPGEANANQPCIELHDRFFDSATGEPVLTLSVFVIGVQYHCFGRAFSLSGTLRQKSWHVEQSGNLVPCAPPAIQNVEIKCMNANGVDYTSGQTLPESVASMLECVSRVVNTGADEMRAAGRYFFDGVSWVPVRDENRLVRFTGRMKPNRKYFASISRDTTFTLPGSHELEPGVDNAILLYLNLAAGVTLSFSGDVLYYRGEAPKSTEGFHELIITYNVLAGKWQVGEIGTGAAA